MGAENKEVDVVRVRMFYLIPTICIALGALTAFYPFPLLAILAAGLLVAVLVLYQTIRVMIDLWHRRWWRAVSFALVLFVLCASGGILYTVGLFSAYYLRLFISYPHYASVIESSKKRQVSFNWGSWSFPGQGIETTLVYDLDGVVEQASGKRALAGYELGSTQHLFGNFYLVTEAF